MFSQYTDEQFENLSNPEEKSVGTSGKQHNILVLIGNGFDIDLLNKYGESHQSFHQTGKIFTSSYSDFFDYLNRFHSPAIDKNLLYSWMKEAKKQQLANWSDFESLIEDQLNNGFSDFNSLRRDLDEIREIFSEFLNKISPPSLLAEIGRESEKSNLAIQSLQEFLGDLDEENLLSSNFSKRAIYYDLYNFIFLNFNYTHIFDSYIYLDKNQFNPHPFKEADRNFFFKPDPKKYKHPAGSLTENSCYVMTQIQHPHGQLTVSRSMLFGVSETQKIRSEHQEFIKPYWAQNNIKYSTALKSADFFIIYGMSLGTSDKWWWNEIFNSIKAGIRDEHGPELLIYYYDPSKSKSDDEIKKMFIDNSGNASDTQTSVIKQRIYINLFSDSDENCAFSTASNEDDS